VSADASGELLHRREVLVRETPFVEDRLGPNHGGLLEGVGIWESGNCSSLASDDPRKARSFFVAIERMTATAALFESRAAGVDIGFSGAEGESGYQSGAQRD
jgi:hypothetical protein